MLRERLTDQSLLADQSIGLLLLVGMNSVGHSSFMADLMIKMQMVIISTWGVSIVNLA